MIWSEILISTLSHRNNDNNCVKYCYDKNVLETADFGQLCESLIK